jgi:hypothetical protein
MFGEEEATLRSVAPITQSSSATLTLAGGWALFKKNTSAPAAPTAPAAAEGVPATTDSAMPSMTSVVEKLTLDHKWQLVYSNKSINKAKIALSSLDVRDEAKQQLGSGSMSSVAVVSTGEEVGGEGTNEDMVTTTATPSLTPSHTIISHFGGEGVIDDVDD